MNRDLVIRFRDAETKNRLFEEISRLPITDRIVSSGPLWVNWTIKEPGGDVPFINLWKERGEITSHCYDNIPLAVSFE